MPFIVMTFSPRLRIYVGHHHVIHIFTLILDVGQSTNMAIIYIKITSRRELHSLLCSCLPLMKRGIQLVY